MTILDPLEACRRISSSYRRYLTATFAPRRPQFRAEFDSALGADIRLTRGPYLQASPPFAHGVSVEDLIGEEVLAPAFRRISPDSFPTARKLHLHQEQAIRLSVTGQRNLVVATGTGSGKTECFLLPIINHLLREEEAGSLSQPGVRALLLYPMNALANDQVKRLRRMLADLPGITFGRYVGETSRSEARAADEFRSRYPSEPRVENELISRERMQEAPPHILLTNYAMLEYLLLRPEDSSLFDGETGKHWKFVVLDEAHVYNGAQGTEVAMLLRRVRDRVLKSERGRLRCFATSATLGQGVKDHPALVQFATDLFDETFECAIDGSGWQDVVTATRLPLVQADSAYELPQWAYKLLQDGFRGGKTATALHEDVRGACSAVSAPTSSEAPAAYLARLLRADQHVVAVQELLEQGSAELADVASHVFVGASAAEDLVALIDLCVASRLRPDDAPLIPARYHFFLRSLEGAFCCLHPRHDSRAPSLRLARHLRCPTCARQGIDAAMFELGVCRTCRAEYLVGQVVDVDGEPTMRPVAEFRPVDYLLLGEPIDADDEDGAATGLADLKPTVRQLCPGCARLTEDGSRRCGCPVRPTPVRVWRIRPAADSPVLRSCAACSARTAGEVVSRFLTGTDAPVAVVATDLYQSLPPSDDRLLSDRIGEGRKLLTFADSRQDAAFFAPYLENTYIRAVRRSVIAGAIGELSQRDKPRTEDIVFAARKAAEDALVLDPDAGALQNGAEVGAWLTEELLALDRRQSLEGTGMAEIAVALPRRFEVPRPLLDLGLDEVEAIDLVQLLLETVRAGGAITMPEGVDVRDVRFAPRNFDFGLRENGSEHGVISWLPISSLNRRLDLLAKIFSRRGILADPRTVLTGIWRHLADPSGPWSAVLVASSDPRRGALWRLAWNRFEFLPLTEDHRPSRCSTCRRVWWRSVSGVCSSWRCPGTVTPIDDLASLMSSHYASLYRQLRPIGMSVQEHTGQLTSSRASSLQDDFTSGRVNVLSCSTTFELGVDVGEIQAVLLRNVPPSAANYVQRAGRAGRRTDAAALVVTFAQRRSHDLTHFDNPRAMVDGFITPPVILLDNPAIVRRHAHSVAFAAFERRSAAQPTGAHRTVGEFFVPTTDGEDPADREFISWLRSRPSHVGEALARIVPPDTAQTLGIKNWSWIDALVCSSPEEPSFGWLGRAGDDARDQLAMVRTLIDEAAAAERFALANRYKFLSRTLSERQLFGFLATRNVLPKYGFPVDVVELDLGASGDTEAAYLDLSRDLAVAISEYSPGSQVVAAKVLWVSTGLGVRAGHVWPTYRWGTCGVCGAFRQHLEELPPCSVCGSETLAMGKTGTFVIPQFGFVGKRHSKPGESRPLRQSSTETYFGAYRDSPPGLEAVTGLGGHVSVERRTSRQGRITIVNRGPAGRGFRLCEWCGYGEAAPSSGRRGKGPTAHTDIRRPGRQCNGSLVHRQLGHEYLTDVTEVHIGLPMDHPSALSTLYALLEGVSVLAIARDDVNGTLHRFAPDLSPALVIFDAVPGGAGHARRIADGLPQLFQGALARVETCECGPETSCYNCLRNYRNQIYHDSLSRGAAADVLKQVLGRTESNVDSARGAGELELAHDSVRPLVRAAIESGAPVPIAGFELGAGDWSLEIAWPEERVAILIDSVPEREAWLKNEQWDARSLRAWTIDELRAVLHSAST